jgi:hypothetical protein
VHPFPAKPEPVYFRNIIENPLSLALLGEIRKNCLPGGSERSPDSESVRSLLQNSGLGFDFVPQNFDFVRTPLSAALGERHQNPQRHA